MLKYSSRTLNSSLAIYSKSSLMKYILKLLEIIINHPTIIIMIIIITITITIIIIIMMKMMKMMVMMMKTLITIMAVVID